MRFLLQIILAFSPNWFRGSVTACRHAHSRTRIGVRSTQPLREPADPRPSNAALHSAGNRVRFALFDRPWQPVGLPPTCIGTYFSPYCYNIIPQKTNSVKRLSSSNLHTEALKKPKIHPKIRQMFQKVYNYIFSHFVHKPRFREIVNIIYSFFVQKQVIPYFFVYFSISFLRDLNPFILIVNFIYHPNNFFL